MANAKPNTRRERTEQLQQALNNRAVKEYAQNNIEQYRFDSLVRRGVIVADVPAMRCGQCPWWESFYMAFDCDPDEDHDVGYCLKGEYPYDVVTIDTICTDPIPMVRHVESED